MRFVFRSVAFIYCLFQVIAYGPGQDSRSLQEYGTFDAKLCGKVGSFHKSSEWIADIGSDPRLTGSRLGIHLPRKLHHRLLPFICKARTSSSQFIPRNHSTTQCVVPDSGLWSWKYGCSIRGSSPQAIVIHEHPCCRLQETSRVSERTRGNKELRLKLAYVRRRRQGDF